MHALAQGLRSCGCDVHVLRCMRGGDHGDFELDGVRLHARRIPRFGRGGARLRRIAPDVADRISAASFVAASARRLPRPDIVEAPDWLAEGLLVRRALRRPLAVHIHSPLEALQPLSGTPETPAQRLAIALERRTLRSADLIMAASSRSLELPDGSRLLPPEAAVHLVPTPLDLEFWARVPDLQPGAEPLVTVVGRLERAKGADLLIQAVERSGMRIKVRFVGGIGSRPSPGARSFAEEIMARCRASEIDSEFFPTVARSAMPEVYAATTVVAVPSRHESFSMVAAEAMASGRPVLVSDRTGISEVLTSRLPGSVVEFDPDAWAHALAATLRDPIPRARAARQAASELFDPSAAAKARLALYRRVVPEGRKIAFAP